MSSISLLTASIGKVAEKTLPVSVRFSESNAQLSEVMTTLTNIGLIIFPLSLIAGIAGMTIVSDFVFFQIILVMLSFTLVIRFYFYRKGWIDPQQ